MESDAILTKLKIVINKEIEALESRLDGIKIGSFKGRGERKYKHHLEVWKKVAKIIDLLES
jgi:hypothetical protein